MAETIIKIIFYMFIALLCTAVYLTLYAAFNIYQFFKNKREEYREEGYDDDN